MDDYELRKRVKFIVESNITHYEYEGDDVDQTTMENDIIDLIKELDASKN